MLVFFLPDGNKDLHRVTKKRLDKVLSDVGAMVSKVTALSFDPFFTCQGSESSTLSEEIKQDHAQPIISECRFHSPTNISVVVIGYNIDGPSAFRVSSKTPCFYFHIISKYLNLCSL